MKTRKILLLLLVLTITAAFLTIPALAANTELGKINTLGNTSIGWEGCFTDTKATQLVVEFQAGGVNGFGLLQLVIQGASTNWDMEQTAIVDYFDGQFDFSGTSYLVIDLTKQTGYGTIAASEWMNLGFWGNEIINLNTVKNAWLTNDKLNDAGAVKASDSVWLSKDNPIPTTVAGGSPKTGDSALIFLAIGALILASGAVIIVNRRKVKA